TEHISSALPSIADVHWQHRHTIGRADLRSAENALTPQLSLNPLEFSPRSMRALMASDRPLTRLLCAPFSIRSNIVLGRRRPTNSVALISTGRPAACQEGAAGYAAAPARGGRPAA